MQNDNRAEKSLTYATKEFSKELTLSMKNARIWVIGPSNSSPLEFWEESAAIYRKYVELNLTKKMEKYTMFMDWKNQYNGFSWASETYPQWHSDRLKGHSLICKYRDMGSLMHLGCPGAIYTHDTS